MQDTPKGGRLHIAIFGCRNAGKSSLINALTQQDIALVSEVAGTTTDPVYKAMEILPLGPVMLIDTAGIDDVGALGAMRVERTRQVLNKTDVALLVLDPQRGISEYDREIIAAVQQKQLTLVGVVNKQDTYAVNPEELDIWRKELGIPLLPVSARERQGIEALKQAIIDAAPQHWEGPPILGDLIEPGDIVILVTPIDSAAPKGRMILPQVQTIRDVIDHRALCMVVTETELSQALASLRKPPKLVVTDSQAFGRVSRETPLDVALTSFSILFARHRSDLNSMVRGVQAVRRLRPGDKVLIAEACTHHRQKDDIGTVKIPRWLNQAVGGELQYTWVAGSQFPANLEDYQVIIHCGACMLNRREMLHRLQIAESRGIAVVNYGVLIAHLHDILPRALAPFSEAQQLLSQPDSEETK